MPTTILDPQRPDSRTLLWITVRVWNDQGRLRLSQDIDEAVHSNELRAVTPILLELRDNLLDFQGPPYDEILLDYEDILTRHQQGETWSSIADGINQDVRDGYPDALWLLDLFTDNPSITGPELKERARDWQRMNKMHQHLLKAANQKPLDCHCTSCHRFEPDDLDADNPDWQLD